MKILLFLFVCLDSVHGQPTLEKTWIGPENQYLRIRTNALDWIIEDWFYRGVQEQLPYFVKSDTLRIVRKFPDKSDPSRFTRDIHQYRILKLSRDSLVISGILKRRGDTVEVSIDEPPIIAFIDSAAINDTKLIFNQLTFSTSGCFGQCPTFKIFIDSGGNVRFLGEQYTGPLIGSYIGKLPTTWMEQFVSLLRRSRIEEMEGSPLTLDVPERKLSITLNRKTKVIEGTDFSPFNSRLIDVLVNSYKNAQLVKVDSVSFER